MRDFLVRLESGDEFWRELGYTHLPAEGGGRPDLLFEEVGGVGD